MEIATSRKLGTLLSLTFLWIFPGDALMVIPRNRIEVINGQMVVLQAWYSPTSDINRNTVIWNMVGNSSTLVISNTAGVPSHGSPQFIGRVGFTQTMPNSNVSIFINDTRESDSGLYVCQVIIPGSTALMGGVTLDVKVPPSPPVCKMVGKPVLKGNVTLSCKSEAGKPVPLYRWTKTSPVSEVFFAPMQNENLGTLKLSNLTKNMSGKYVCKASNTAGSETCYINLEINTSSSAGVIAGATVGSVLVFLALLLILIFFLKRRKDSEDDIANDIKEDAQAPKRVSWAKSGTGSDIISKNGTLSSIVTNPHPRDHLYPHHPASDTASIITATGSTMGYRPRPGGEANPLQGLPGYNPSASLPRGPPGPPSINGSSLHRPDQAHPQAPRPPLVPTNVTSANIARMGGVPIMVPAQNQAGSLV
ncbi:endothelial cell adhesion molecule a [Anguilla rostrata]|uniref:endothelial cell adhesion molecule a n=1 Tax=Anguilla rostrata TaxID=7938 RepID=UPI0030CF2C57